MNGEFSEESDKIKFEIVNAVNQGHDPFLPYPA